MAWSQRTCPNNYIGLLNLIDVLESIQRKTNNGPITTLQVIDKSLQIALTTNVIVMVLGVLVHSVPS